jgi:nucleotide-binding universal stress UspA family protein
VPSLSKILLPVDFSERSVAAARYARSLARHFQSELTLLHTLTPLLHEFGALEFAGTMLADMYRTRTGQAGKELDTFMAEELAGLNVRRVLLHGDPAEKIVQFARDEGVGLIAMPTHGHGSFRRFILGSNTAKVLHDADCPVWTGVHFEEVRAVEGGALQSILCAIDLGQESVRTLAWAEWLRKQFKARLTVIHATAPGSDTAGESGRTWRTRTWPIQTGNTQIPGDPETELQLIQREAGAEAELFLEAGEPQRVVCAEALRVDADVLVIGRGSVAGVLGRLRTNAYAIIRQSPCPVISI